MANKGQPQRSGAYQRGEESRQRMIETALDVFGLYGYEGASTRLLAKGAGVNLSAIPYYFGGKEGLYRAVAEYVALQIAERQTPVALKARAFLEDPSLTKQNALQLLLEILDTFAATVIGADDADRWARFVMREQMDPSPAFDILYEGAMKPMHTVCSALVARLLDQPADDPNTLIRTTAIIGQVLVFRSARGLVLKRFGWKRFTDERVKMIQGVIREQVKSILHDNQGVQP